jgi:hypothetical protein
MASDIDGISDLPLSKVIEYFEQRPEAVARFTGVAPTSGFHLVSTGDDGRVQGIRHIRDVGMRVNGGFFVLRTVGKRQSDPPGRAGARSPRRRAKASRPGSIPGVTKAPTPRRATAARSGEARCAQAAPVMVPATRSHSRARAGSSEEWTWKILVTNRSQPAGASMHSLASTTR